MWEGGMGLGGDRGGEPEFFKSDGDFYAVGSLGCVEIDIGGFLGQRHGGGQLSGQLGNTRYHMKVYVEIKRKEAK